MLAPDVPDANPCPPSKPSYVNDSLVPAIPVVYASSSLAVPVPYSAPVSPPSLLP